MNQYGQDRVTFVLSWVKIGWVWVCMLLICCRIHSGLHRWFSHHKRFAQLALDPFGMELWGANLCILSVSWWASQIQAAYSNKLQRVCMSCQYVVRLVTGRWRVPSNIDFRLGKQQPETLQVFVQECAFQHFGGSSPLCCAACPAVPYHTDYIIPYRNIASTMTILDHTGTYSTNTTTTQLLMSAAGVVQLCCNLMLGQLNHSLGLNQGLALEVWALVDDSQLDIVLGSPVVPYDSHNSGTRWTTASPQCTREHLWGACCLVEDKVTGIWFLLQQRLRQWHKKDTCSLESQLVPWTLNQVLCSKDSKQRQLLLRLDGTCITVHLHELESGLQQARGSLAFHWGVVMCSEALTVVVM